MSEDPDFKKLLTEVAAEVNQESEDRGNAEARRLHQVARELLLLERDLHAPGAAKPEAERVERLLKMIEGEEF